MRRAVYSVNIRHVIIIIQLPCIEIRARAYKVNHAIGLIGGGKGGF